MLKKPASFVLAPQELSTYARVRLGLSLATVSLNGLFQHPARDSARLERFQRSDHQRVWR